MRLWGRVNIQSLGFDEVLVLTPEKHGDDRGFFSEVYSKQVLAEAGITSEFVQDNHSRSARSGTVRGLHFQIRPRPVAKLLRVVRGAIWDVAVDIRTGSPTFGQHVGIELSEENWAQIYVPEGFAHGFCTLLPETEVAYKVTDYWSPDVDRGVAWNDPDLGIEWPVDPEEAVLSDKDRSQPKLRELPDYFSWSRS